MLSNIGKVVKDQTNGKLFINFQSFVMYEFNPPPTNDLIELKIMTVIKFELFSFELFNYITKSNTK